MAKKSALAFVPPAPLTAPVSIGAEEVAYLNTLIAQRVDADRTLQKFTAYLAEKYQLGQGDGLRPDGTIQRKAPG